MFICHKFTGIIQSRIGATTSCLRMSTLSLNTTKPYWRKLTRRKFLMKCGILLNISLWTPPLPHCVWSDKTRYVNNIYTPCLNSKEPYVDPNSIHHYTHSNIVLFIIINLMWLVLTNDQWLCLYNITQFQTNKASFLITNK